LAPQHPVDAFLSGIASVFKNLSPRYWHYAKSDIFATVQSYEFKMIMEQDQSTRTYYEQPITAAYPPHNLASTSATSSFTNSPGDQSRSSSAVLVALKAIELNIYKNVPIHNGKLKQINTSQLYRGLANNLRNQMITTNSSHVSQHDKDQQDNIYNYINLIDSLSVLDPKKWPTSDNDEVENISFGDDKIRHLCRHF